MAKPKRTKKLIRNSINIGDIDRIEYMKRVSQFNSWFKRFDKTERPEMESNFGKVRKEVSKLIEDLGVVPSEVFSKVIAACITYSDSYFYQLDLNDKLDIVSKNLHFVSKDEYKLAKNSLAELSIARKVVYEIATNVVVDRNNSTFKKIADEIHKSIDGYQRTIRQYEGSATDKKTIRSSKDRAVYEIVRALAEKLPQGTKQQPILETTGKILSCIYQSMRPHPKDGWEKQMRSAYNRYQENIDNKV